jgi:hypothetical protein
MPYIRFEDGTQVWVPDPDEPPAVKRRPEPKPVPRPPPPWVEEDIPAHLRRGRFDKRRNKNQTERQHIESGLGRMYKAAKAFLLDDDGDDIAVAAKMLDKATKDE